MDVTIVPMGEVWREHDDSCGDPARHIALDQVMSSANPRLAMVVDDNGVGQFFTTLSTEDAVKWLRQVADDVQRRGTCRVVAHLN